MTNQIKSRKWSLLVRFSVFVTLLTFTPVAVNGMINAGYGYGVWFFMVIIFLLLPDIFIKLFLLPVSASFSDKQISVRYFTGKKRQILLDEISGYSSTQEPTRYGVKNGVFIYLKNQSVIHFTEINSQNLNALIEFLNACNIECHGSDRIRPWFLSRRLKYKSLSNTTKTH